jgi:hypothetical protein
MAAIIVLLGITLIILVLLPNYFHLSKVFRVLKVLTAISFLVPILAVVWLYTVDPRQVGDAAYIPDIFVSMLALSTGCIGGLAFAWLVGYAYWLYAKKTNLFEISSLQVALMLVAAVVGRMTTPILVLLMLFGSRH